MIKRIFLKSAVSFFKPLIFAFALFLVFEEWLWENFKRQLTLLGHLPFFACLDFRLKSLSPWGSLLVLIAPAFVLLPFKILALWALSHHHAGAGIFIIVVAKLIGTAIAAHLFDLVRDNARKIGWFDWLYLRLMCMFDWARHWLNQQPAVLAAREAANAFGQRIASVLSSDRKGILMRKVLAAKRKLNTDRRP